MNKFTFLTEEQCFGNDKLDILYIISISLSKKYITIIANILCEKLLCLSHGNEANIKKKITKYILIVRKVYI